MTHHMKSNVGEKNPVGSKADFLRLAGIEPELAEFVAKLIEKPEDFYSMSIEKRREIEDRMDAILSSFRGCCR